MIGPAQGIWPGSPESTAASEQVQTSRDVNSQGPPVPESEVPPPFGLMGTSSTNSPPTFHAAPPPPFARDLGQPPTRPSPPAGRLARPGLRLVSLTSLAPAIQGAVLDLSSAVRSAGSASGPCTRSSPPASLRARRPRHRRPAADRARRAGLSAPRDHGRRRPPRGPAHRPRPAAPATSRPTQRWPSYWPPHQRLWRSSSSVSTANDLLHPIPTTCAAEWPGPSRRRGKAACRSRSAAA